MRKMGTIVFCLLLLSIGGILSSLAATETNYYELVAEQTPVKRLCTTPNILTVNGQFPGPTITARNGDSLVITVTNNAPHSISLLWRGLHEMTPSPVGPKFVTECPIRPGQTYTYLFKIESVEGTLFWHAHSRELRAMVYGALVIFPKSGFSYPFLQPNIDLPILIGEWWDRDMDFTGVSDPMAPDAYTINGQPGDLYKCSSQDTTRISVNVGDRVLLRIINAAIDQQIFFAVANHELTVVGADAAYNEPFTTRVVMVDSGQTIDVILTANQPPSRYYMAARPNAAFDSTTTTAILEYKTATYRSSSPVFPLLPPFNDTAAAAAFTSQLKGLPFRGANHPPSVAASMKNVPWRCDRKAETSKSESLILILKRLWYVFVVVVLSIVGGGVWAYRCRLDLRLKCWLRGQSQSTAAALPATNAV